MVEGNPYTNKESWLNGEVLPLLADRTGLPVDDPILLAAYQSTLSWVAEASIKKFFDTTFDNELARIRRDEWLAQRKIESKPHPPEQTTRLSFLQRIVPAFLSKLF